MRTRTFVVGAVLCLLLASTASAQLNRTFVASTGNDANDCSRATPCRNFAAAILQTNAGGEIIPLDSAGYGPTLNITKAVSIVTPTGIYAGMTTVAGAAISVNAPGAIVVLRGLYLNALGGLQGVVVTDVGRLYIENSVVNAFQGNGVEFHGAGELLMTDSISRNNGNTVQTGGGVAVYGLDANNRAHASIDRCRFEGNGSGFIINDDGGVVARGFSEVTVTNSVASGNVRGFVAASGTATDRIRLTLEGCAAADNVVGIFAANGDQIIVRVAGSVITHNTLFAMEAQGTGQITTRGNNTVIDNNAGEAFTSGFGPM